MPKILLAQFLKAVQQITWRKLRAARVKFWQERYYDSNVRGEAARSEVIRSSQKARYTGHSEIFSELAPYGVDRATCQFCSQFE